MAAIRLNGQDYPVVDPDDMTMGEQREFEKIAGRGVDAIFELSERWSAAVVTAWMVLCIRRVTPQTPVKQIVATIDKLDSSELAEAWQDAWGDEDPTGEQPATSSGNSGDETPSEPGSNGSSETDPEPGTLPGTGSRSLADSAGSPSTTLIT